jgi:hypothetical protein
MFEAILLALFPPSIDPAFLKYVHRFEYEAKSRNVHHIVPSGMRFGNIVSSRDGFIFYGVCRPGGMASLNHVEIDEDIWNTLSEVGKELLVFHELGHCRLEKLHSEVGIMRSNVADANTADYAQHRDEYIEILFREEE